MHTKNNGDNTIHKSIVKGTFGDLIAKQQFLLGHFINYYGVIGQLMAHKAAKRYKN